MVVLDGEVAVPCNLQSAIAGFNSKVRLVLYSIIPTSDVEASIRYDDFTLNPVRPGREQR